MGVSRLTKLLIFAALTHSASEYDDPMVFMPESVDTLRLRWSIDSGILGYVGLLENFESKCPREVLNTATKLTNRIIDVARECGYGFVENTDCAMIEEPTNVEDHEYSCEISATNKKIFSILANVLKKSYRSTYITRGDIDISRIRADYFDALRKLDSILCEAVDILCVDISSEGIASDSYILKKELHAAEEIKKATSMHKSQYLPVCSNGPPQTLPLPERDLPTDQIEVLGDASPESQASKISKIPYTCKGMENERPERPVCPDSGVKTPPNKFVEEGGFIEVSHKQLYANGTVIKSKKGVLGVLFKLVLREIGNSRSIKVYESLYMTHENAVHRLNNPITEPSTSLPPIEVDTNKINEQISEINDIMRDMVDCIETDTIYLEHFLKGSSACLHFLNVKGMDGSKRQVISVVLTISIDIFKKVRKLIEKHAPIADVYQMVLLSKLMLCCAEVLLFEEPLVSGIITHRTWLAISSSQCRYGSDSQEVRETLWIVTSVAAHFSGLETYCKDNKLFLMNEKLDKGDRVLLYLYKLIIKDYRGKETPMETLKNEFGRLRTVLDSLLKSPNLAGISSLLITLKRSDFKINLVQNFVTLIVKIGRQIKGEIGEPSKNKGRSANKTELVIHGILDEDRQSMPSSADESNGDHFNPAEKDHNYVLIQVDGQPLTKKGLPSDPRGAFRYRIRQVVKLMDTVLKNISTLSEAFERVVNLAERARSAAEAVKETKRAEEMAKLPNRKRRKND